MAKEWTRNISDQKSVELEVNLLEIFKGNLVVDSRALRESIGQEVIDIIRERTQEKERSWTGASFRRYSEEYADSIEFKAYNKSKDEPNLTQTGDMLGLMTVLDSPDPAVIKIGWTDSLQSEKAHGHITGAVGVKRDFFGLTAEEITRIKNKFSDDTATAPEGQQSETQNFVEFNRPSIRQQSVSDIIDQFFPSEE